MPPIPKGKHPGRLAISPALVQLRNMTAFHSVQMNIMYDVVGSRGDVQPFISLGKVLT